MRYARGERTKTYCKHTRSTTTRAARECLSSSRRRQHIVGRERRETSASRCRVYRHTRHFGQTARYVEQHFEKLETWVASANFKVLRLWKIGFYLICACEAWKSGRCFYCNYGAPSQHFSEPFVNKKRSPSRKSIPLRKVSESSHCLFLCPATRRIV